MERLGIEQLEILLYSFLGLILLAVAVLIIYVIVASRRRDAEVAAAFQDADDLVVRPSLMVVGQVLALVRDEAGGPLRVEIDGVKYGSLHEVKDPTIKRQIIDAALEMIHFTGVLASGAPALSHLDETDRWREDLKHESQAELKRARAPGEKADAGLSSAPAASGEVEDRFLGLLTEMGQSPTPLEKPTLTSSLQQRLRPKSPDIDEPRSLVHEIEEIVQRKVQLEPALVGRGLHVLLGQEGAVSFTFEGQGYEQVDEIPNLTARTVIQESIQEWEELS
jgi:hypothetical protein